MCGIVGICSTDPAYFVDRGMFHFATDLQAHRGPDEGGASFHQGAALGTRRLSIIDLPSGQQPMSDPTGRYHITYNGELYNFRAVRHELEKRGSKFRTNSDTEVVLMSFVEYGPDCLARFNGMFGFAIWDDVERTMFAARDRIGIKPLFYSFDGHRLILASETPSIRALFGREMSVNPSALNSYLAYRSVAGTETFYNEISQLLPGHYLVFSNGKIQIEKYWGIPTAGPDPEVDEAEAIERFRELFGRSIERRLVSDVPVTAFLSGGVDSSIVVAEMAQRYEGTVNTFTIGIEGFDPGNESLYAREVARMYGTHHNELVMTADEYVDLMVPLTRLRDAPLSLPNEIMISVMSKEIRKYGKVVLSGEGGDELGGGYGRIFRSALDWSRMQEINAAGRGGSHPWSGELIENLVAKYGSIRTDDLATFFLQQYSYNSIEERASVLHPDIWADGAADASARSVFESAFAEVAHLEPQAQFFWVFPRLHLQTVLERLDRSTMSESLEARVPYLDHEMVEFMQSLPVHLKSRWESDEAEGKARFLNSDQYSEKLDITRWVQKAAYRDQVPQGVIERVKVGFPTPVNTAMRKPLYKLAREVLLDRSARESGLFDNAEIDRLVLTDDPNLSHHEAFKVWLLVEIGLWHNSVFGSKR